MEECRHVSYGRVRVVFVRRPGTAGHYLCGQCLSPSGQPAYWRGSPAGVGRGTPVSRGNLHGGCGEGGGRVPGLLPDRREGCVAAAADPIGRNGMPDPSRYGVGRGSGPPRIHPGAVLRRRPSAGRPGQPAQCHHPHVEDRAPVRSPGGGFSRVPGGGPGGGLIHRLPIGGAR